MALKAGLKYYPEELGFLLRKNSAGDTAYELIVENGDEAWVIIEECLEEIHDEKITEKNAMTNLYPFIVAAAGDTSELNTLYYLLRRSAVVLESFRELDSVGCIEKKRQRWQNGYVFGTLSECNEGGEDRASLLKKQDT